MRENVLRAVAEGESSFKNVIVFLNAIFLFKIHSAAYHSKGLDMKNSKMSMFFTKTAKTKNAETVSGSHILQFHGNFVGISNLPLFSAESCRFSEYLASN